MKYTVVWSIDALEDIARSVQYASEIDVDYAQRLTSMIRASGDALGLHDTGRPGRMPGTREKSVLRTGHILSYHVDRRRGEMTILHVVHSRQKWSKGRWPRPPSSP